jgi:hypothetical protein
MAALRERLVAQSNKGECGDASEIWCAHDPDLLAESVAELDRLTTLEAAVREVIRLVNVYLPEDTKMTHKEFVSGVAGAVDNPDVFRALEKVK